MTADEPAGPDEDAPTAPVDEELDLRNLACPLPVLKTRKALQRLTDGSRIRVLATDGMALIDIPHFCAENDHRLLARASRDGVHYFLIERGAGKPR